MSLKSDAFPSSVAFDTINDALKSDKNEAQNAIKAVKAIFAFTLKNGQGKTESWYIDLKEKGEAGRGLAPEGQKATATLQLSDEDFQKLVEGKANAQSMFMSGKLRIKGNVMASQKLTPILAKASQAKAKL